MSDTQFDIRDGRHHYRPCPKCGAVWGMGLTAEKGLVAVTCTTCWFVGPGFIFDPHHPLAADNPAFDAWNTLARDGAGAQVPVKGAAG